MSDATSSRSWTSSEGEEGQGPDYFVAKGIEFRGKGDLPKSAWYFMKAAEAGSSNG